MEESTKKCPPEVIKQIAGEIGAGLICYLNPDTLEKEGVLNPLTTTIYTDEEYKEISNDEFKKIDSWEHCLRIDPLESWESFKIMERSVND